MKPQHVQEALQAVHAHQHHEGDREPSCESQKYSDGGASLHRRSQQVFVEDLGELTVCQAQSPESKVARRVGDGPEAEFDGLDELMDQALVEMEFFFSYSLT